MINAERLMAESEKMRQVPGIHFVDSPTNGRVARVLGTGLEVFEIIHAYQIVELDLESLLRSFHWLKAEQILAALDYYRAFPDEIDRILDEADTLVPDEVRAQSPPRRGRSR